VLVQRNASVALSESVAECTGLLRLLYYSQAYSRVIQKSMSLKIRACLGTAAQGRANYGVLVQRNALVALSESVVLNTRPHGIDGSPWPCKTAILEKPRWEGS